MESSGFKMDDPMGMSVRPPLKVWRRETDRFSPNPKIFSTNPPSGSSASLRRASTCRKPLSRWVGIDLDPKTRMGVESERSSSAGIFEFGFIATKLLLN